MTAPTIYSSADDLFRRADGLGVWPYRGQVAAVGVGHSPTLRRWDGDPQKSIGAWTILAIRNAIEDAGVNPAEVEGLVFDPGTTTGAWWPEDEPVPPDFLAAFQNTSDPFDGLIQLSAEWLVKNMPELTGLKFVMAAPGCMSNAAAAAAEAVGRGMGNVVLSIKGWHNIPGRYGARGTNAQDTVSGPGKHSAFGMFAGPPVYSTAVEFQRYLYKYGKTHDMMAPFVTNSRSNGLKFPEGYWYQHRPTPLTAEEYNESRWVAEPANLYDNDIPIHTAAAYLFTTAERARDMRQPPAYVLGHAGAFSSRGASPTRWRRPRGGRRRRRGGCMSPRGSRPPTWISRTPTTGSACSMSSGSRASGIAGIKEGEALDFFGSQDISINGPTPISPSGGNIGSGRTRFWMWTDTIQQIQGRAGERQIKKDVHVGFCGGPMVWSNMFAVFSNQV